MADSRPIVPSGQMKGSAQKAVPVDKFISVLRMSIVGRFGESVHTAKQQAAFHVFFW